MAKAEKYVYLFGNKKADGNGGMKPLLGGKGANLAEMASLGLPVPPGFTITTEVCTEYYRAGKKLPKPLDADMRAALRKVEALTGKGFGDARNPLLVSVRSGARVSMPGMMDTVLNLGLNDTSINGLIAQTGNERFAWDSYRRFIQMFSKVVLDAEGDLFENAINKMKLDRGVKSDTDLSAADLKELVGIFKGIVAEHVPAEKYPQLVVDGKVAFPMDVDKQLNLAIEAVFSSWMNDRAVYYRKMEKIADDLGISIKTVEWHRSNLMSKLDVHSIADLVRYAMEHELAEKDGKKGSGDMAP